jgi:deoxyribodipyrimidine photo-lyase
MAKTVIYWFRNDLRLHDNPALTQACQTADYLVPVYWHNTQQHHTTTYSFVRMGQHRQVFLQQALNDLNEQLQHLGSQLTLLSSASIHSIATLAAQYNTTHIMCEDICAPEEQQQVAALRELGLDVTIIWQSSLYQPDKLPFSVNELPRVFSQFRQKIEQHATPITPPIATIIACPPLPTHKPEAMCINDLTLLPAVKDARSAFAYADLRFNGGERAALDFAQSYFNSTLPQTYKQTRNGLWGVDYSSKLSPWLASGALSVRYVYQLLQQHEAHYGANDSTYWLWFELLWRDYFRFLHQCYGQQLYRTSGLGNTKIAPFNASVFKKWATGQTGNAWIDAGMRELAATGYLSNRMRQNVASYWLHELVGNWQAGAAWFESVLLDYDVYSNQGNWLYLAGIGTDPRSQRWFNPNKQAQQYDPTGQYQTMWHTP